MNFASVVLKFFPAESIWSSTFSSGALDWAFASGPPQVASSRRAGKQARNEESCFIFKPRRDPAIDGDGSCNATLLSLRPDAVAQDVAGFILNRLNLGDVDFP